MVAAAVRAVVRFGSGARAEGRRSWFSLRTSCLAAPSASVEGTPWEPSRDCFPDEIADERVADGVDEWRRCVAELELKIRKEKVGRGGGG